MTMTLRFDGTNDHVTLPVTLAPPTNDWSVEFKVTIKLDGTISVLGASAGTPSNQLIQLRVANDQVRIKGTTGTDYDVPCPLSLNETCTILITSTVSPARLTVFKNGVQTGQLTYTQTFANINWIGRTQFSYGMMDLYYLRVIYGANDFNWSADGVTSGTILPELNNSANNGTLVGFSGNIWINDELFTLPSSIEPLVGFTSTVIAPFVDGAATISFAGESVAVTIASGQFTVAMPFFVDGDVYPRIPTTASAITLTQGGNNSTIYRPINLPSGYDTLRAGDVPSGAIANFDGIITDNQNMLGYHFAAAGSALTTSDTAYFVTSNNYWVYRNSDIGADTASLPRTDTLYIHRASGAIGAHSVTINAAGDIVSVGGLSVAGLINSGLSNAGLSVSGL